jgi:sarcosine oxidase subunit beta
VGLGGLRDEDGRLASDAPLPARAAIAIVGGGVIGLSIAYDLARRGLTDVVVFEKGYLAQGASGRNGGGVRAQWSVELNVRLMRESIELCKAFAHQLGVNVWFRQGGYLFLARTPAQVAKLEKNVALQNRLGLETRVIDPIAAGEIVPELDLTGIAAASYNPADGILFPWPFLWGYAQRAVALGARLYTHTGVRAIERLERGFRLTTDRGVIEADRVVNAAGAWSSEVARMVGVELPTWATRHEICSSEPLKPFLGPMVSELGSGLYFSQSMRGEIVGGVTVAGDGRRSCTVEQGSQLRFLTTYARRLVAVCPRLSELKILRQWAGAYDCSPDGNPILGCPPGVDGFYLACGFVGHGFMMAPVIGKLYGEWLTGGARHEVFERYPLERFARGGSPPGEREDFNIG